MKQLDDKLVSKDYKKGNWYVSIQSLIYVLKYIRITILDIHSSLVFGDILPRFT